MSGLAKDRRLKLLPCVLVLCILASSTKVGPSGGQIERGWVGASAALEVDSCLQGNALRHPPGEKTRVLEEAEGFIWRLEGVPQHPYWPQGKSGVTWGVGWDAGQHTASELRQTWMDLGSKAVDALSITAGRKGIEARELLPSVQHILIPEAVAKAVFKELELPKYYAEMIATFPGATQLPTGVQVALLSLVFNRGAGLGKVLPDNIDSRFEIRTVKRAVSERDITGIYYRFSNMTRVWEETSTKKGMEVRRRKEMQLIRPYICF